MMKSFNSKFSNKIFTFLLLFTLSIIIFGCTNNSNEMNDDIIDDTNELSEISFQDMFNNAMTQFQNDDSYNLVIEMNRKRANESQSSYRRDDYTFFNQEGIFAFYEDGENFFERIEGTVYSYFEDNNTYVQTLAYPVMDDWEYDSFLPIFSVNNPTLIETESAYEYLFSVNAETFLNAHPSYLAHLLTISNATLKAEDAYDLSGINFNITVYFNKPSQSLFSISFDTVEYLNEVLDTHVNGYEDYIEADVHFLYNTNLHAHDLSLIDTYSIDDYPNYAWADVNRTFIELNTPKSIHFQYTADSDLLSLNVTSQGNYHIEINHEYRHSFMMYDDNYNFMGFYYMESGYYDIDLEIGCYYLVFNAAGSTGQYEISITLNS